MPTAPGPRANKVCVGGTWAGGVAQSATGGGLVTRSLDEGWSITSNSTAVIAKEYDQR